MRLVCGVGEISQSGPRCKAERRMVMVRGAAEPPFPLLILDKQTYTTDRQKPD